MSNEGQTDATKGRILSLIESVMNHMWSSFAQDVAAFAHHSLILSLFLLFVIVSFFFI